MNYSQDALGYNTAAWCGNMKRMVNRDGHIKRGSAAFSLVELAVVLVILGLLLGGVLAGASLIRAAERRNIVMQQEQFVTATQTFRQKYFELPGDFSRAGDIWGLLDPDPNTCAVTSADGKKTCNGDNNGRIKTTAVTNYAYEQLLFWGHLINAELLPGTAPEYLYLDMIDLGTPVGRLIDSKWSVDNWAATRPDAITANTNSINYTYGNIMSFGKSYLDVYQFSGGAILTPEELWNIDVKYDDGKPGLGQIHAYGSTGIINCATTSTAATAQYKLDTKTPTCAIIFLLPF